MGKFRFKPDKFNKKKKQEINSIRRNTEVKRTNIENAESSVIDREDARAPYNFVPLNKLVIEAEIPPNQDCYYPDPRITGHIDCALETLTPIYVRDTLTQQELKQKEQIEKAGKRYINSDFFSPCTRLRIPGSSLRGMIRTLVEIATWSKFQFFEDKGLYYRGLADKSNLRNEYQKNMNSFDKNAKKSIYKMFAGYLKNIGFQYYIIPAESKNGTQFKQILTVEAKMILKGKGFNYSDFSAFKLDNDEHLVISGGMDNKKHDWIIFKKMNSESSKILVSDIDIENYEGDINRTDKANLLKKLKSFPDGIPCFYIQWKDENGNNRVSFGHTGMFRLAYTKSIGEHVPENLKNEKIIDLTEAIFGKVVSEKNKQFFSGRVFFEDAVLINQNENPILEEAIPETLSSPKPTTFQHYLKQESNNIKNLQNYNSNNTNIRGNKLYWHKSGTIWKKHNEFNENIDTKIKPVKPNTKFNFRIRFENLSLIELGAILFALKLPPECAHKIGMGKPLGLGSVKITPELFISDRKKRYSSLFENEKWSLSENKNSEVEIDNRINLFQKYILGKIGAEKENASSLWETSRLKKLKLLLDVEIGKKLEKEGKIRYMSIEPNEFKDRRVLPTPEKLINQIKNTKSL